MTYLARPAIASLALALAVAACGDDGGDSGYDPVRADASSVEPDADSLDPDAGDEPDAATEADAGDLEPPAGMVLVPAGAFTMGSSIECEKCDTDERPQHEVTLSAYFIDRTEVPQQAYAECVSAGACTAPSGSYDPEVTPLHPVVSVTWDQAVAYCEHLDKRLPTEAEWEKAARGTDGRLYPWGDEELVDCKVANVLGCGGAVWPVGATPTGASPYGALDMAGNVWEWTADYYAEDAYESHAASDPQGPATGTFRVYRGGSASNYVTLARTGNRASTYNPEVGGSGLGFRCARSAE